MAEVVDASCVIQYSAAFLGGFDIGLPVDLTFEIASDPPKQATAVNCVPVNYREFEDSYVPSDVKADPKYAAYYLIIDFAQIESRCELLTGTT